jgi:hypothetical protein
VRAFAYFLAVLLIAPAVLPAKRLPIKTYTTADGPGARSLSRFDGYRFLNDHTEQGLPGNVVTGPIETRAGDHRIARLTDSPGSTRRAPAHPDSAVIRWGQGQTRFVRGA